MTARRFPKWTADQFAQVERMMRDGWSGSQIAEAMGCTRNVAIGRVHRNKKLRALGLRGLSAGPKQPRKPRKPRAPKTPIAVGASNPKPSSAPAKLRVVSNNVPMMVADWLAKNGGARRFECGASADYHCVVSYLEKHGYSLNGFQGKFKLSNGSKGRPRFMAWRDVIALVDKLRIAEGLPPILAEAA